MPFTLRIPGLIFGRQPRGLRILSPEDLSRRVTREVRAQTNGACPMPRCSGVVTAYAELITEDSDDDSQPQLLLGLCAHHASLARSGAVPVEMLLTIRQLLDESRVPTEAPVRLLSSRRQYLQCIVTELNKNPTSLLISYVGPLPLHPEWYHVLRDAASDNLPNMDRIVGSLIRQSSTCGSPSIRVIFRNSDRYVEKLHELLTRNMIEKLKSSIDQAIDEIFGKDRKDSLQMCCFDAGYIHIPTIFPDSAVTAARESPNSPIAQGVQILDSTYLKYERDAFNRLFESTSRGMDKEIQSLREFVSQL